MPSPKKKPKKTPEKGSVTAVEKSPKKTRKSSSKENDIEEDNSFLTMEPPEEFIRSTVRNSTSKPSPSGRKRSFKKISLENSACIPINDDCSELTEEKEDEKIQNKSDVARDKTSVKLDEEKEMSIVQTMTLEQMQEHVARCLELSTENKINSKNAFALKLIDCMTIISKNMDENNFAAMACQLDAGAKIYSHRVDAVHHQVMKLVETCIFAEKRAAKQRTESEGQGDLSFNDGETPGDKVKDKRKKSKKKVIATSDQISRKLKENDPREKYVKCEALPGGIFQKVKTDPKDLSLTLLKHTPFWMDWQNYKPVRAEGISEIRPIVIKNQRLGPVLEIEQDIDLTTIPKLEALLLDGDDSDSCEEPIVDFDDEPLTDMMTDDVDTETEADSDLDMVSVAMNRMQQEKNEVSRLDAMKAVFHRPGESDYHYLKMDNSYYWAGPDYWKRPHGLNAAANLKKLMKKKKEPTTIEYTGPARKISLHPKERLSGLVLKRTTTLSDKALAKWTKKKVTFPQDIHFRPQTLLMLFHVETYSDNILNCPPQLNESGELDFGHEDEDDDDAGDAQNLDVTATVDTDDTDTENNEPHAHNEEEDDESDEPKPDVATPKDEDDEEEGAVGVASTSANGFSGPCDVYEGENLVPMVKTVKFDPIKYTAKPNRVDMGHLKQVLLALVLQLIEEKESEMRSEGIEEPHGSVPFRNVVIQLFNSEELHHRTREDLTHAMSFLALLSIASENAFHLVNDETGDVIISLRSDRASIPPTTTTCFSGIDGPVDYSDDE